MREYKVVVIGAGVAGLKAAQTLVEGGYTSSDVIVLEALARIGGRVKTDTTSSKIGAKYDLGAAWFHDGLTNSVLHELVANGLFDLAEDGYFDDRDLVVFAPETEGPVDVDQLRLHRVVEDIERFIEIHYHADMDAPDVSLKKIVDVYFEKYRGFVTDEQRQYCGRIMQYLELWYGISWDTISAKYAIMDHEGRNIYNKRGYSFLVDQLKEGLTINMSEPVVKINRNNKNTLHNASVTTTKGTYYADYVVVAVPQSILQNNTIEWEPQLPPPVAEALDTIHFGALGKVIFEFDRVWWGDADRFLVLAHPSEVVTGDFEPFSFPAFVVNYAAVQGKPSLVVLTQAPLTQWVEANPDRAWGYFGPMLHKLAVSPPTDPVHTIVTDWTLNPWARGSYAAVETGDEPLDLVIQLSAEYPGTSMYDLPIRFAGEHTIADGAGCVHGAYNSGVRAARWILQKSNVREEKI